ncbi:MAG: hypothetical protein R3C97_10045 [Geminicoccaceae bacterium]
MAKGGSGKAASDETRVPLKLPIKNPFNVPAVKNYVFNETGNIMLSTTDKDSSAIQAEVRSVFAEVSVFFAAMTRAITTTIDPTTKKPYSLYSYEAISRVVDGSGLFIRVTEEDVLHTSSSWGADFSKELVEGVLGLATGAGELTFASAMISSMGKEGIRVAGDSAKTDKKIGNIIFVCEYLLGMPIISAIVIFADMSEHEQELQVGPCFKEHSKQMEIRMHKDTYMFVTPTFIHKYAGDIDSTEHDPAYAQLISFLRNTINQIPAIGEVVDNSQSPPVYVTDLKISGAGPFRLDGNYLGDKAGTLAFAGAAGKTSIKVTKWEADGVTFTVSGAAIAIGTAIELRLPSTKASDPADLTTGPIYTVS